MRGNELVGLSNRPVPTSPTSVPASDLLSVVALATEGLTGRPVEILGRPVRRPVLPTSSENGIFDVYLNWSENWSDIGG